MFTTNKHSAIRLPPLYTREMQGNDGWSSGTAHQREAVAGLIFCLLCIIINHIVSSGVHTIIECTELYGIEDSILAHFWQHQHVCQSNLWHLNRHWPQGSGCIFSHSSRIDWKRTVERYLSPKLGKTTWNHHKWKPIWERMRGQNMRLKQGYAYVVHAEKSALIKFPYIWQYSYGVLILIFYE